MCIWQLLDQTLWQNKYANTAEVGDNMKGGTKKNFLAAVKLLLTAYIFQKT